MPVVLKWHILLLRGQWAIEKQWEQGTATNFFYISPLLYNDVEAVSEY